MPAFGSCLTDEQRDDLVSFVIYLSLRGQVEFKALASVATDEDFDAKERLGVLMAEWMKAEAAPALAAPDARDDVARQSPEHLAKVRRGFELFMAKGVTDCAICHETSAARILSATTCGAPWFALPT